MTQQFLHAAGIGIIATLCIDLWSLLLKYSFGIASLNYCLLGRWFLHMPGGTFVHQSIGVAQPRRGECAVGWLAHYLIGISLAVTFVAIASMAWLARPTLLPALAFGLVTTLIPFLVMQPSLGFGVAASRTPNPAQARLKSVLTHTIFGLGLYGAALLLNSWFR
jgi:hypothetical protein